MNLIGKRSYARQEAERVKQKESTFANNRKWVNCPALGGVGRDGVSENVPEVGEEVMRKRKMQKQGNAQQQQDQERWCGQQKSRLARFAQLNNGRNDCFVLSRTYLNVRRGVGRLA